MNKEYKRVEMWLKNRGFPTTCIPVVPVELCKNDLERIRQLILQARQTFSADSPFRTRIAMILEEFNELLDSLLNDDVEEFADALGDLLFTVLALGATYSMPLPEIFNRVLDSNETKGKFGKKPDTYKPPVFSDLFQNP